jgi:hypothetical protein
MRRRAALDVVEAFEIGAVEAIDQSERTGFGQEGVVINKSPQREHRVHAAGLAVIFEDASDLHHRGRPILTTVWSRFAAS